MSHRAKGGKPRTRAAIRKNRDIGISAELEMRGMSRELIDEMNGESIDRFNVGIGAVVQERDRAEKLLAGLGGWAFPLTKRWWVRRRASAEFELWNERLHICADAVAEKHRGR